MIESFMRNELARYDAVNECETIEELQEVILSFADERGEIKGRTRYFNAQKMADFALKYYEDESDNEVYPPNLLTRNWGIRQQAMYIKWVNK